MYPLDSSIGVRCTGMSEDTTRKLWLFVNKRADYPWASYFILDRPASRSFECMVKFRIAAWWLVDHEPGEKTDGEWIGWKDPVWMIFQESRGDEQRNKGAQSIERQIEEYPSFWGYMHYNASWRRIWVTHMASRNLNAASFRLSENGVWTINRCSLARMWHCLSCRDKLGRGEWDIQIIIHEESWKKRGCKQGEEQHLFFHRETEWKRLQYVTDHTYANAKEGRELGDACMVWAFEHRLFRLSRNVGADNLDQWPLTILGRWWLLPLREEVGLKRVTGYGSKRAGREGDDGKIDLKSKEREKKAELHIMLLRADQTQTSTCPSTRTTTTYQRIWENNISAYKRKSLVKYDVFAIGW